MPAVLFGSISTIADTSELQRAAFNEAFRAHGLDWTWDREDYTSRLQSSGGQQRIAEYAKSLGQDVDAAAVHRSKSEIFQKHLAGSGITVRPGVAETIRAARTDGLKVALVTTTSPENVSALLQAVEGQLGAGDFDVVVDATSVEDPKPAPAAYAFALSELDERAADCIAVEDNLGGLHAAVAAGVRCIAFPNENTTGSSFDDATDVVDRLDPALLQRYVTSA